MDKTRTRLNSGLLTISLLLAHLFLSSFTTQTDTTKTTSGFKFKNVVIDAGHGGKDPGALGTNANEKTIALGIAKKLRDAIKSQMPGVNVIMTRTDDTFIELNRRSQIANKAKADLFISIHCNSSPDRPGRTKGVMMLVYKFNKAASQAEAIRENASIYLEKNYKETYKTYDSSDPLNRIVLNAYLQKYRKYSILFADLVNKEFKSKGRQSLGIKEQDVFVLAHTGTPAVLVETGFINHPEEGKYLSSEAGQKEIAQGILRALKTYKTTITVQ